MYRTMMNSETGCKQLSLNAFDSLKKEEVWCEKKKEYESKPTYFSNTRSHTKPCGKRKGRSFSVWEIDDLRGKQ